LHDRYEQLAKKITLEKHYLAGAAFFHFGLGMKWCFRSYTISQSLCFAKWLGATALRATWRGKQSS